MIKYILFGFWYLFMIILSYRGIDKMDEGVDHWDITGAVFGSLIWPLTWLIIGMNKVSKKIIDQIEKEFKEHEND